MKKQQQQQTSSAQAERRGPHRYDLGVRSTLPSTGSEQLHQTRKQTTQRNAFFPFFIEEEEAERHLPTTGKRPLKADIV